jgi:hypothetical protein
MVMKSAYIMVAAVFSAMVVTIASVFFLGKDNPVEQAAEAVVKAETGLDVDFTPEEESK